MTRRIRRYAGLLGEASFRRLFLAQSISQFGTQITQLALPLVAILILKASAFEVAALGAIEFLPFVFFTLPAGAWVDRLPRRKVLVVADLGRAAILGLVPLAAVTGVLAMWQLYAIGFSAGALSVFFDVAYQAILPELVDRERLAEGNSRLEIGRTAAWVLGPGIGGFLVGIFSAPIAILGDALSYLGSAAFLIGIRVRGEADGSRREQSEAAGIRREIVEGLRFYARSPLLLAESAAIVALNLGGQIAGSIFLVFVVRDLEVAPERIGLALSIGAIGLVLGATGSELFGRRIGVGPALIVASAVSAASTAVIGFANPSSAFALLVVGGFVQGLSVMVININGVSLRQSLTPDDLQGRVNATGRWINWGIIPVGSVIGGGVATVFGLQATIFVGAAVAFLAVPALLLTPIRTLGEMPSGPVGHSVRPPA
jgi:MFS family permease